MIKFNNTGKLLIFLAVLLLAFNSCKKSSTQDEIVNDGDEFYITQAQAIKVATNFSEKLTRLKSDGSKTSSNSSKTIAEITPIKGENDLNAYYIINYKEGGFTIVSADKRSLSIMAYSETGLFKHDLVPSGLDEWLNNTKVNIDSIRDAKITYKGQDTLSSKMLLKAYTPKDKVIMSEPEPDPGCTYHDEVVGPLTFTAWSQGSGYNDFCPAISCGPGGHAYTGCSTTAIAQIVRYHQFPAWYNYSQMGTGSSFATASMMGNIFGMAIDEYDCEGSSNTLDRTYSTLRNFLGYATSLQKLDYSGTGNYSVVQNELRASRPVIFAGGHKGSWFVFPVYESGHQWVCDGFVESAVCGTTYTLLHMNWGWGGNNNGFFAVNGFNPGGNDFNYKSRVLVGIHP